MDNSNPQRLKTLSLAKNPHIYETEDGMARKLQSFQLGKQIINGSGKKASSQSA